MANEASPFRTHRLRHALMSVAHAHEPCLRGRKKPASTRARVMGRREAAAIAAGVHAAVSGLLRYATLVRGVSGTHERDAPGASGEEEAEVRTMHVRG